MHTCFRPEHKFNVDQPKLRPICPSIASPQAISMIYESSPFLLLYTERERPPLPQIQKFSYRNGNHVSPTNFSDLPKKENFNIYEFRGADLRLVLLEWEALRTESENRIGKVRTGRTTAGKHGEQDCCFCSLNNWKNKENKFLCSLKRILITKITPFVKCVF